MAYKCGNMLSIWKHWEKAALVAKNKAPIALLDRSFHKMTVNTKFCTKLEKHPGKIVVSYHEYHRSAESSVPNFGDTPFPRGGREQRNTYRSRYDNTEYRNSRDNFYNQRQRNNFKPRNYYLGKGSFDNATVNTEKRAEINWESEDLPPITKNCYQPHPNATSRDPAEIALYRKENEIVVTGDVVPNPILNFEEANFPDCILHKFRTDGFDKPTPIQAQAWPIVMSGYNLIGIAETGSGKTLGYVLPALVHIMQQKHERSKDPIVVILAPTRELAQQIQTVADSFGRELNIGSVCFYGGRSKQFQLQKLRYHTKICVATPGRLLDFLSNDEISLKQCTFLAIDEADRMLDMGFEPQLREILSHIRPDKQVVMWSASWPKSIVSLAATYIKNPIKITIGSPDGAPCKNVNQIIEVCFEDEKRKRLEDVLQEIHQKHENNVKILIFTNTKLRAEQVARTIESFGYNASYIHGNNSQRSRDIATAAFRSRKSTILVATDVIARGFDVPDIDYVINVDFPNTTEQYIHRIGRTGRSGKKGNSHTFFTSEDKRLASELIYLLKEANQEINPELIRLARNAR